ncbi:hypothetical protein SUGI_0773890 [Cryptomeria japonica]|nr:hypothetical protein SUGI_0773890 [Cryptomeria japonica]
MASLKIEHSSSYMPERFHNKWNNDFVQSLETPYEGSEYRESVETLVNGVKILLKELQIGFDGDLIERLEMVDALQCLGIDRYFLAEIKEALDYVYGCWDGSVGIGLGCKSTRKDLNATAWDGSVGIGLGFATAWDGSVGIGLGCKSTRKDLNATALGLRNFKNKNGQFISHGRNNDQIDIRDEHMMRSMINLLRASSLAFLGETVMKDAKVFSSAYLKQLLEKSEDINQKSCLKEAEYSLLYEWASTFPRWEARSYIEIYELDNR